MDYARLGSSGLRISRIVLGMMSYGSPAWRPWVLSEEAARPFVRRALDFGINTFDTADMYSLGASEEVLGRALKDFARRDDVVVATKVFYPVGQGPNDQGLSRYHIMNAIDASLRRLGMDHVDLYQIHRWDPHTPLDETLRALEDVVRAGKVRYLGASSMFAWQLAKALGRAEAMGCSRFVSMQNHYNLAYREEEREMLPLCLAEGVGCLPWSPLARGLLAGTRRRSDERLTDRARTDALANVFYGRDQDFDIADAVATVAAEHGRPPAQIALAWLLSRPPVVAPIVGATKLSQLDDAVAALEVRLSAEQVARLEAPYRPLPTIGHE